MPMPNRGPEEVPPSMRGRLVATFNSGFKLADSGGGFAYGGHTYAPLHDGLATIVRYRSGRVDVIAWTGGPDAGPDVVYARQNLPLIVNHGHGQPEPVRRPRMGRDARQRGLRVALRRRHRPPRQPDLRRRQRPDGRARWPGSSIHAGAVRAMELDINSYWPSFITYRFPGAGHPANLLADMVRSPLRYLTPDDRDFFAVYLR